ncbi:MAG: hypothetical protein ACRDTE_14655 [Pseudonocardiaceae bacterium]
MANRADELVTASYARATGVVVIIIVTVWHIGFTLPRRLTELSAGQAQAGEFAVWLALAVIGAAGAFLLLRGHIAVILSRVLAVCVVLLAAWVTVVHPPEHALDEGAWAWISVGWFGLVLLIRQPLWVFCSLLMANSAVTGAYLALNGIDDRVTVGRFVVATCMTAGIQLVTWLAAAFLHRTAAYAAKATAAQAATRARETTAEEMHTSRADRYGYLAIESRALLAGLADGSLDPGDPEVRLQCAIESARLRRLFAETDDVADPILHELRACADATERRNVTIDLVAFGEMPQLPVDIRRALLDAPLIALSATVSHARVTVVANPDEVVVSVLGDAAPETRTTRISRPNPPTITITEDHDGGQLWVQAHWAAR